MSESGFIYAIGVEGLASVKIGKTAGPVSKRLAMLQIGHPTPLQIRAAVFVEQDLSRLEKTIHRFLGADRQRGEWFAVAVDQPQLEALIMCAVQWLAEEPARRAAEQAARLAQGPSSIKPIPRLGQRLQALRERRGLSIAELAERAGTSYQNIWRIERGAQLDPSIALMRAIARALGVGLDYLSNTFGKDEESEMLPREPALV